MIHLYCIKISTRGSLISKELKYFPRVDFWSILVPAVRIFQTIDTHKTNSSERPRREIPYHAIPFLIYSITEHI
eukprot:UN19426